MSTLRTNGGPSGFSFTSSVRVAHDGVGCCDEFRAILGCADAELEQCLEWRGVAGSHDHPLRLTEHDHDLVVVLGPVEQALELAHGVVGGTSVFARPLAVTARSLSVVAGSYAITGCMVPVIGCAPEFLGVFGWRERLVRPGGVPPIGGLISPVCCAVRIGGDGITLTGALVIDPGSAVPIVEVIELLTSHGPHASH